MVNPGMEDEEDGTRLMPRHPGGVRKESAADIARYCVVVEGSEKGKQLEIGFTPISVGRRSDNHFPLSDPFVSSHHCDIAFEDGQVWVLDLNSTNGTLIDGVPVHGRAPWPLTSTLQLGSQILRQEYHRREDMRHSTELTEELRAAAIYVRSLLPPPLSGNPVATAWYFLPCRELGGDIFDYFWLDRDHFVFYLLDVCGHGIGAALHSVSVFNLLRQTSLPAVDFLKPAEVLTSLNNALPMERYGNMYFTLWYGVYDKPARTLTFACGGHPPALFFDHHIKTRTDLLGADPPIGFMPALDYHEATFSLPHGGRLYLYSDGVYEIIPESDCSWGWAEFTGLIGEEIGRGQGQPEAIFRKVCTLTGKSRFEDDFSLLLLDFP
jgi:serine phosphatase RsbU (regulator of sigma subunit)